MKAIFAALLLSFASSWAWSCETVQVKGMDCGSCAKKIEKAFQKLPEVKTAKVDFKSGTLVLQCKKGQKLARAQIEGVVKQTGFELN